MKWIFPSPFLQWSHICWWHILDPTVHCDTREHHKPFWGMTLGKRDSAWVWSNSWLYAYKAGVLPWSHLWIRTLDIYWGRGELGHIIWFSGVILFLFPWFSLWTTLGDVQGLLLTLHSRITLGAWKTFWATGNPTWVCCIQSKLLFWFLRSPIWCSPRNTCLENVQGS